MRWTTISATSILVCLFITTTAHALITSYGQRQIAAAGAGCVGGLSADHGTVSYYRGDTSRLNEQLALLASGNTRSRSVEVVLHAGESTADSPEERPQDGMGDPPRDPISVDWLVRESCPFDKVRTGRCQCDERIPVVHVWVANNICLDDLVVPDDFSVRSGGEIDGFVDRHAAKK